MDADQYILNNRENWDNQFPKHDVVISDYKGISFIIPNDNSAMGIYGPMWTPEAIQFMSENPFPEGFYGFYSIDGGVAEDDVSPI